MTTDESVFVVLADMISTLQEKTYEAKQALKELVKQRDIPVDQRWRLFINSEFGINLDRNVNLKSVPKAVHKSIMDNYYVTHERVPVSEYFVFFEELSKSEKYGITAEMLVSYKEEIMAAFISSFVNR